MLDDATLRIAFALTALTLLVLFFTTYRTTRSQYSRGWTIALAFLLAGGAAYLFIDTPGQAVALPFANALTVVGIVWAWRAARSLRMRALALWHYLLPAAVVAVATAVSDPGGDESAGAPVLFLTIGAVMAATTREIFLLGPDQSRVRPSLLLASGLTSAYYLVRFVAALTGDFDNAVLAQIVSEATATVITQVLLVVVSFSMTGLSRDEVERRLRATASRTSRELNEGAQVQQKLLPARAPELAEYPLAGACVPSRSLSGDFYDWQETDEGLVITVGDVMGKGVGAAMLGATVRAGLRLARGERPDETVSRMLSALGADLVRNDSFVTLFHAHLDRRTGELTVLDAGHGLAVVVRRDGTREQIASVNLPLGLGGVQEWTVQTLTLEPCDRLLVFSDGVLDLFDGSLRSLHRAVDIALAPGSAAPSMPQAVARIEALALENERDDDVTVVALEHLPQGARACTPTARDGRATAP